MTDLGTRRRLALYRVTLRRSTMPIYAKALVALVTTALAQLAAILTGTANSFSDLTDGQWVTVASASLLAAAAVYGVRNGVSNDPTTSTPEVGSSMVELAVGVLLIIILVLVILRLAP